MTARTWDIRLPWAKPPLSLNDRGHWRARAKTIADVRFATWVAIIQTPGIGPAIDFGGVPHVDVRLTYVPRDKRRRDPDNLTATYKVLCDAVVDAVIVPDDEPRYMTKHMPVIAEPDGDPRLVLTITEVLA